MKNRTADVGKARAAGRPLWLKLLGAALALAIVLPVALYCWIMSWGGDYSLPEPERRAAIEAVEAMLRQPDAIESVAPAEPVATASSDTSATQPAAPAGARLADEIERINRLPHLPDFPAGGTTMWEVYPQSYGPIEPVAISVGEPSSRPALPDTWPYFLTRIKTYENHENEENDWDREPDFLAKAHQRIDEVERLLRVTEWQLPSAASDFWSHRFGRDFSTLAAGVVLRAGLTGRLADRDEYFGRFLETWRQEHLSNFPIHEFRLSGLSTVQAPIFAAVHGGTLSAETRRRAMATLERAIISEDQYRNCMKVMAERSLATFENGSLFVEAESPVESVWAPLVKPIGRAMTRSAAARWTRGEPLSMEQRVAFDCFYEVVDMRGIHPLSSPFRFLHLSRDSFNADVRVLQLVLGIWAWHADNGAWPETPAQLVPEYLSADFVGDEARGWQWMIEPPAETPYLIWNGVQTDPDDPRQSTRHWVIGHALEPHFTPELIELLKTPPAGAQS